jgi:hypothetical protein
MSLGVHRGGKPEGRLLLIEAINEGTVGTINELGLMQWQHLMAQQTVACVQGDDGHFERVL